MRIRDGPGTVFFILQKNFVGRGTGERKRK